MPWDIFTTTHAQMEYDMSVPKDLYAEITEKMLKALDSGVVPWQKPWKGGGKNAPRNAMTNRPYRGINVLLLSLTNMVEGFSDNRWATFKAISAAGGKVLKGSKGTQVILWKPVAKDKQDADGNTVRSAFMLIRSYTVFNIEQTEGLKLPAEKHVEGKEFQPIDKAEMIFNGYFGQTYAPPFKYGFDRACFIPSQDRIELPAREQFISPESFYQTAWHEAAHSTGHKSRLDRKDINDFSHFGDDKYAKEELIAEMSSAFLCAYVGIDNVFDNSVAYIGHWRNVLKEDNRVVVFAAQQAQKAFDFILNGPANKEDDDS